VGLTSALFLNYSMVHEHQRIDLFGKMLFERAVIEPPFRLHNPMPSEACFIFIVEGNYKIYSESNQMNAGENDGVLMKCGNFFMEMHPSPKGLTKAVAVHFYPEVLKKLYNNDVPSFLKEKDQLPDPPMVRIKTDELVRKFFDSLLFYFENPELVTEELLILKTKELLLLLDKTSNSSTVRALLSNLFSPRTYSFKEVVNSHVYDHLNNSELAELCNMSLSSFKREFKKVFSDTPAKYFRKQKLEKAKQLLVYSDKNISEIAFECGFSGLVAFSSSFQHEFGRSPSRSRTISTEAVSPK